TYAGLFSAIGSSGRVENVVIKDATLQGSFKYAGAIAGYSCGKIGKCNAENVTIANTLADSMNGGIVGFVSYQKSKDIFANYGSVEMCSATISSTAAGTVGGIAGKAEATFIYNCKATINSLTQGESSVAFGGVVGEIASVTSGENFYLSILKNCYALLNNVTFAEKTNGGLVGNNADDGETYNNIFRNNYFSSTTDIAGVGATTKEVAVADKKSYAELQQKATYANWDFENAWTISEGLSTAEINFKGDYSAINEYIPGSEINSLDALKTIIESIRKNPEISKNYEITGNIEYDLGGAEWETIAPNQDQPLASSILCEEGVTVTIKNFKISGDNSSFFGYVAGENTKISGLVFKDVIMDTTAPVVGIVSTILTNATIENCAVENASIKTSDTCLNVGYVAGINLGTINNCSVNKNTAEANNLESASLNVKMGGIAGTNMSKITNSSIDLISFLPTDAIDSFAEIGGIAGRNEKTLQNCYNYSATLQTSFNGQLFAGGVAGVNANGGTISSCLSTAKIDINMSNDKVYVGGITGYNNADCLVEKSYFAKEEIKASQVAGIALVNKGKIDQCLFQGSLVGKNASGLAKTNYSTISNCSILGSVNGFNSSSVTSGYVYSLEVGCMVKHCFSNMSFGDTGKHYAESASDFRVVVEKVLQIFNQYP
ncbi:MAG: hypothetical protein IJA69_01915, partial [Clostridia bacterium]|nr:hypothetical protein [Clostridia bacterium]